MFAIPSAARNLWFLMADAGSSSVPSMDDKFYGFFFLNLKPCGRETKLCSTPAHAEYIAAIGGSLPQDAQSPKNRPFVNT